MLPATYRIAAIDSPDLLIISQHMANYLDVKDGDTVTVTRLFPRKLTISAGTIPANKEKE